MILVDYITSVALVALTYLWIQNTRDDELVLLKLILRKLSVFFSAIVFMILSKDNKGVGPTKNPDPDRAKDKPSKSKTIIFIRHGESDWNNVFNKGINPGMILRLVSAMRQELAVFSSLNSVFIDSPLNEEGVNQAVELSQFLEKEKSSAGQPETVARLIRTLRGDGDEKSVIVTSSLRRAISTTTLAMWPRIKKTHEKIYLLSMLQEISRNVDTYQLSPMRAVADLPFDRILPHCGGKNEFSVDAVYDTAENYGTKTRSFYGIKRLEAFADWVFKQPDDVTTIIVGGHSLWFKYFFQTYLPHSFDHDAKNKKIANSGIVAFTLHMHDLGKLEKQLRIDPASIVTIYGGFTSK